MKSAFGEIQFSSEAIAGEPLDNAVAYELQQIEEELVRWDGFLARYSREIAERYGRRVLVLHAHVRIVGGVFGEHPVDKCPIYERTTRSVANSILVDEANNDSAQIHGNKIQGSMLVNVRKPSEARKGVQGGIVDSTVRLQSLQECFHIL